MENHIVFSRPLTCRPYAERHHNAVEGNDWHAQRIGAIFMATVSGMIVVTTLGAIAGIATSPDPTWTKVAYGSFATIFLIPGVITQRNALRTWITLVRLPTRRTPKEEADQDILFLQLCGRLAKLYPRLELRVEQQAMLSADGRAKLQSMVDELCRIDGELYVISQREPNDAKRSEQAIALSLPLAINRLEGHLPQQLFVL